MIGYVACCSRLKYRRKSPFSFEYLEISSCVYDVFPCFSFFSIFTSGFKNFLIFRISSPSSPNFWWVSADNGVLITWQRVLAYFPPHSVVKIVTLRSKDFFFHATDLTRLNFLIGVKSWGLRCLIQYFITPYPPNGTFCALTKGWTGWFFQFSAMKNSDWRKLPRPDDFFPLWKWLTETCLAGWFFPLWKIQIDRNLPGPINFFPLWTIQIDGNLPRRMIFSALKNSDLTGMWTEFFDG